MPTSDTQMTPLERRATWGLGILFSLRMLGMFMVLPVLGIYSLHFPDASTALVGIALGVYGLTQALCQIPFGLASDFIGRKPVIIGGLLIFTLGSLIAANSQSIWGIIIGRALQGCGAITAPIMALLSDLTREQNRTKAMAFIGISFGLTFALAMVLGPIITDKFGFSALFWLITGLALIGVVLVLFFIPNPQHQRLNRESAPVKDSFRPMLFNRQLVKLNIGIFSLHTLLMATFVSLPLSLVSTGLAAGKHWIPYLVTLLISFIAVIPLIIYAEKKSRLAQVFSFCILIFATTYTLFFLAKTQWLLIIGLQLFFIAFNVMEGILPSWVSKEAPAGTKGTALGLYAMSQSIGIAVGGIFGGWLFKLGGGETVALGCLLLVFVWLLISLTMREPPALRSIRMELSPSNDLNAQQITQQLLMQSGVLEVMVVTEEKAAYVKIDHQQTNRQQLEKILN